MKRLTLNEAIGQTLLATIEIGSEHLLRFSGGCVRLETHYEGHDIYDFTDGDDPLGNLYRHSDGTLTKLLDAGFITETEKTEATDLRQQQRRAYEHSRELSQRAEYEALREKFETKNKN